MKAMKKSALGSPKAPQDKRSVSRFFDEVKGTSFGDGEWTLALPFALLALIPLLEAVLR